MLYEKLRLLFVYYLLWANYKRFYLYNKLKGEILMLNGVPLSKEKLNEIFEKIKQETCNFVATGATMLLLGPTGVGKSVMSNAYAQDEENEEVLIRREGDGLSSLIPTDMHPTDLVPSGYILQVMKFKKVIISDDKHRNSVTNVLFTAGMSLSKDLNTDVLSIEELKEKLIVEIKACYSNELRKKDNTSLAYMISFAGKENELEIVNNIAKILGEIPANELIATIKSGASRVKKSQEKAEALMCIAKELDSNWVSCSQKFWAYLNELIESVRQKVYQYATYDSDSDSLFIWLSKYSKSEVKDMFLNSKEKSFEFLFEKMDIYYRISDYMLDFINNNDYIKEALKNRYGSVLFTASDSKGLFHENDNEESAVKDAKDMIYKSNSDLVLFFISAEDEALSKKSLRVLAALKSEIKRNIEFLVLMPKVDKLATQIINKNKIRGRFSRNLTGQTLSSEEIITEINNRKEQIGTYLDGFKNTGKRSINIREIMSYGIYSYSCPEDIISVFDPIKTFENILTNLATVFVANANKIRVELNNDVNDLTFQWVSPNIKNLIKNLIINDPTFKASVCTLVLNNISANKDRNGHGNCVNAVIANSRNGDGHNGQIDESWFVNVESIDIQFPVTLRNIATSIINRNILQNISISNARFVAKEDEDTFRNMIDSVFSPSGNNYIMHGGRKISAKLFYENHIMPELQKGFFYHGALLKRILQDCYSSYSLWNINNVDEIVDAYIKVVQEACEVIRDKYMVYVR